MYCEFFFKLVFDLKKQGRDIEADNSPPPNDEVQNEWRYTSASPYAFTLRTGSPLLSICSQDLCNHHSTPNFATHLMRTSDVETSSHRGNRTSHCLYRSHSRIRVYEVLFTVTSKCVCGDGKSSENTKAWKDVGLSDFAVVVHHRIPLQEFMWFTLLEFAFRALFFQRTHVYKHERNILMYWGADKSLARPGRKHAYVSVRMSCISSGALPCRKKKLDDSSRLDAVEIARVPDMLPSLFPSWLG